MTRLAYPIVAVFFALFLMNARVLSAEPEPAPDPAAAPAAPAEEEAEAPAEPPVSSAPSKIVAVTVYRGTALVTREVEIPAGKGLSEIIVTPLPEQTVDSSLYTEAGDGIRVLSTRYRTRAVKEDTRAEVRALEKKIKDLAAQSEVLQRDIQVIEQNLQLLSKLENFTSATMAALADKGLLNGETTIALSKFVMESRGEKTTAQVAAQQQIQTISEQMDFTRRQLEELTAGARRFERDAVITVDKADAAVGTVRLNYLVSAASWRPQYKLRAGKDKDPVQLEYLAAIQQQSGEDWTAADVTLSTAEPMLNAAPPDLLALDITVLPREPLAQGQQADTDFGGGKVRDNYTKAQQLRQQAQVELNKNNTLLGWVGNNEAAALEQTVELLANDEDQAKFNDFGIGREGPSVTYHLATPLTIPSRNDEQLIEVARVEFAPEYFYKAVPVLTPHVYRLANLTNKTEHVLLPGEATMYLGADFVGRMNLPLVAIGQTFTVGFGVDPQLQVDRSLAKKTKGVQGGNQIHSYIYRIRVSSFKTDPVTVQVWDRIPKADEEAVGVSVVETTPALSSDPTYVRAEKPENLLRWDVKVEPGMNGEDAATIDYQFKLEYDRNVAVGDFKAKQ